MPMASSIGERLLCNAIQVACTALTQCYLRPDFGEKVHFETVQVAASISQRSQSKRQSAAVGAHREQSSGERAGSLNGLIHERDDFIDVGDSIGSLALNSRGKAA